MSCSRRLLVAATRRAEQLAGDLRSRAAEPGRRRSGRYSMAGLLRQAIDAGAPPSLARLPMTPEQVAQSYADTDNEENQECDEDSTGDGEPNQDPDPDERTPAGNSPSGKPGSNRTGDLPGADSDQTDAEDASCPNSPRQSSEPEPSA